MNEFIRMALNIYLLQDETTFEGVTYLAGWYFSDETEDLHGPFGTMLEAQTAFQDYLKTL